MIDWGHETNFFWFYKRGGLALVVCWLLIASAPAHATTQICDSYALEMSPQELGEAALKLKYNMPASRVGALLKVVVQNTDADGPIAPYVASNGNKAWTINVPRGFRRLQCRLLQYQFYKIGGSITPEPGINDLITACAHRIGQTKCFEQFVVRPASELEARYPYDAANADRLRQLVNVAFDNVMMHEAAHIVLRSMRGKRDAGQNTELQADLLALAGSMGAGNPQIGAIATPAMMSLMDGLHAPTGDDHPPAACRAANNDAIVREIGPQIGAVFQWLLDPAKYPAIRSQPPNLAIQIWIPGDRSTCAPIDMARTKTVHADLSALLTILDGIRVIPQDELARWEESEKFRKWRHSFANSLAQLNLDRWGRRGVAVDSRKEWERHPAERQFDAILEKLLGFAPQTPEGQRLRATISGLWMARWLTNAPTSVLPPDPLVAALPARWTQRDRKVEERIHILANLDRLDRSWAALTRYDIASEDYGRLLGLRALYTYFGSPPGSSIKKVAGQLLTSLNEADIYYSGSINALSMRGFASLLTGQCALARGYLKQARPSLYSADRGQLAMIDSVIASDDAQCGQINQDLRAELKRDLQWVD